MLDDDKKVKDEAEDDSAEEETTTETPADAEPEAEAKAEEVEEKSAEVAEPEEPKADDDQKDDAPSAQTAGTDQQGRTLYNVKCSNCGKDTQVPFQPSEGRPVYCRDCYMKMKNSQG